MANGGIIGSTVTITKSTGGNSVSKFTSPGTFNPSGSDTKLLDVLIVAGGGGGGAYVKHRYQVGDMQPSDTLNFTVGAGGAGETGGPPKGPQY